MILHAKSSGDGGGGGFHIKRPTQRELLYNALLALYVDRKDGVVIHKNCFNGMTGKVPTEELVPILCRVLVENVFDGHMALFQAGMQEKLERAVNRIIKE
jgi:hypothetical protein